MYDAWSNLFLGTQDDHSPVVVLLQRFLANLQRKYKPGEKSSSHFQAKKRDSYMSAYPLSAHERANYLDFWGSALRLYSVNHWIVAVHKCLLDGKWKSCSNLRYYFGEEICSDRACEVHREDWWQHSDFWVSTLLRDDDTAEVAKRFVARFWPGDLKNVEYALAHQKYQAAVRRFGME